MSATSSSSLALGPSRKDDKRLILGGVAFVLGLFFLFRIPTAQALHTLSAAECAAISPLVESCATAPERAPRIFIGTVDKSRWALMDGAARREVALALAEQVAAHGWVAATVMLEEQVVIQIEAGNVLVVQ